MNPPVTFPAPAPELKLPRTSADKWAATLAEERRRLLEDQEALRERESNLRDYEQRLRGWQAQLDAGRASAIPAAEGLRTSLPGMSYTPAGPSTNVDTALQAGWEKLHRAREILEAEQTHLRDDRIAIREMESAVKRREEAVTLRETQLAEREALVNAAMPSQGTSAPAPAEDHSMSAAMTRITRAPFDLAWSVFGGKK